MYPYFFGSYIHRDIKKMLCNNPEQLNKMSDLIENLNSYLWKQNLRKRTTDAENYI